MAHCSRPRARSGRYPRFDSTSGRNAVAVVTHLASYGALSRTVPSSAAELPLTEHHRLCTCKTCSALRVLTGAIVHLRRPGRFRMLGSENLGPWIDVSFCESAKIVFSDRRACPIHASWRKFDEVDHVFCRTERSPENDLDLEGPRERVPFLVVGEGCRIQRFVSGCSGGGGASRSSTTIHRACRRRHPYRRHGIHRFFPCSTMRCDACPLSSHR